MTNNRPDVLGINNMLQDNALEDRKSGQNSNLIRLDIESVSKTKLPPNFQEQMVFKSRPNFQELDVNEFSPEKDISEFDRPSYS